MMNSLAEHNFQNAFKNGRRSGNGAYAWKRTILWVIVASMPKVIY
jgi:hypothetical protein